MIDAKVLVKDLQGLQKKLEQDLRRQIDELEDVRAAMEADYQAAREAKRTANTFGSWSDEQVTQASVAWLLGCVFARFCEDNRLIPEPLLAGPGEANRQARERAREYFSAHPTENERHYLEHCFRSLADYPIMAGLYDPAHNPLFRLPLSWEAAKNLVAFWQRVDPDSGELMHDFTDPALNTRFLGDLYQDLSEAARKRYALLQTPEFVEEFILERTLEPAISTFGLDEVRLIDPTCGSGHFLLGAFHRLLEHWAREAPGLDIRERVKRAVGAVYGVDLNPFAVAIARFRLLAAALGATGIRTLKEAPGWRFNVTAGDSLLHGQRFGELDLSEDNLRKRFSHAYSAEDIDEINRILGQQYHAVVGNPPYIKVEDKALSSLYRTRYTTCHGKYSLGVPFTERFFQLTLTANNAAAGYVGLITTNSFMKRQFGKNLIEDYLPLKDLSHVIDTSGAYIPGHTTPTVMLFGRHQEPVASKLRVLLGIRGEPSVPNNPANGEVWSSVVKFIDHPRTQNDYISVVDIERWRLEKHPWSLEGGSAPEVLRTISNVTHHKLGDQTTEIGFTAITGEDGFFVLPQHMIRRIGDPGIAQPFAEGACIRDWRIISDEAVIFPQNISTIDFAPGFLRFAWPMRIILSENLYFRRTKRERNLRWFDFVYWSESKLQGKNIVFSFVATHNHFVLNRGGRVFKQSAPVIKLPLEASIDDHLSLLGLLNSSTACFWMKQVFYNKGKGEAEWADRYEHDSTKLKEFPLLRTAPLVLSSRLHSLALEYDTHAPAALLDKLPLTRTELDSHRMSAQALQDQMIAYQEELDWWSYHAYGICNEDLNFPEEPPEVELGERAFEIVLARRLAAGEITTTWFKRHGSTPIIDIPQHWPDDYSALVQRRIDLIESNSWIELLERPEYKRRWNQPTWENLEQAALKDWLLDRLEVSRYWPEPQLRGVDELVTVAERDEDFMAVATVYTGQKGFEVRALVASLLDEASVPALKALRYKPSGLRKRADWEQIWELQRLEDRIDAEVAEELERTPEESDEEWRKQLKQAQEARKEKEIGDIPIPPKYKSADFLNTTLWRLRGALDVPKERFIKLPGNDGEWLYGWAGWNSARRVQAIFGSYTDAATRQGWEVNQLVPLLAAIAEELPWVLQWHNEIDPEFDVRLGDYFREQLGQELHRHGLTTDDLDEWKPAATRRGRRRSANT